MTPTLLLTTVRHTRTSPLTHDFTYSGVSWLIEPAHATRLPRRLRPWARFRAEDHLGDPDGDWHTNVVRFAATQGVDLAGGRILALSGARTLGHTFNPLTVYWCRDRTGSLRAVIAEVHNTYGERHAYLVETDDRGLARTEKSFYVSPFNDVSGHYVMSVPEPSADGEVDVRITLHREGHAPFVTRWQGRPATRRDALQVAARLPLAPHLVSLRIRRHGIALWRKRLPLQARPTHHQQESV